MVSSKLKGAFIVTVLGIALPALGAAQESPAPAPSAEEPALTEQEQQMQGWYIELQQLHTQLEIIQAQALADQSLATRQEALGEEIRVAMETRDSSMKSRLDRMEAIEAEAMAAEESNNSQKLQQLLIEANDIQEHLIILQQQIVEEPAMAAKLDLFQTDLHQKMLQVNPNAQQMMDRFRELEELLTAAMSFGL